MEKQKTPRIFFLKKERNSGRERVHQFYYKDKMCAIK